MFTPGQSMSAARPGPIMNDFLRRSLEIARPGIVESHTGVEKAHRDVVGGCINVYTKIRVGLGKIALARLDGVRAGDLRVRDHAGADSEIVRHRRAAGRCGVRALRTKDI